jgi:hypothetical protein
MRCKIHPWAVSGGAQIPGTADQLTSERNLEPPIIDIEKIDEPPSKNSQWFFSSAKVCVSR